MPALNYDFTKFEVYKNLNIDDLGYLFRNNLKESSIGLSINNYKSLNKSK